MLTFARASFLALFCILLASTSSAQQPNALDAKSNHAVQIRQATSDGGLVRVVVQLRAPGGMQARGTSDENIEAITAAASSAVDEVIRDHFDVSLGIMVQTEPERGVTLAVAHPIFTVNASLAEIEELAADPRVLNLHLDVRLDPTLSDTIPLIGMSGSGGAYDLGATGNGRIVAILDTGVQTSHQWFNGRLAGEACFSGGGNSANSNCPGGALQTTVAGSGANCSASFCWHGTHVAGTAVGKNNSGSNPPNGVSRDGRLIAVQVFSKDGSAYWSDVINALSWLYANRNSFGSPIDAVNMSIGTNGWWTSSNCDSAYSTVKAPIDSLLGAGIATVIAAGNDGQTNAVAAPGCISSAITVSNSTKADAIYSGSNISSITDVVAPGTSILAPVPTGSFGTATGTSMAAPHVAGVFAAIRAACPTKTVGQIESALQSTGLSIADSRSGGTHTKPRVRVNLAVQQLGCVNNYTISVSASPGAGGTVSGGGTFPGGTSRTVVATANSGYSFVRWTENGSEVSTNASYTFTLSGNRTLVANFTQQQYTISLGVSPSGSGSVSGAGTFSAGSNRTVTATANAGWNFVNWTENGSQVSTNSSYTFTLSGNRNLLANFSQQQYTISLSVSPSGSGSVTGDGTFGVGSSQTVTATANSGWSFVNWTENGGQVSTNASYTFTLSGNRNLVANFTQQPTYTISLSVSPSGSGSVSGGGTYPAGSSITVTAMPNASWTFVNWTENGSQVSPNASYSFTLNTNRSLVANFTSSPDGNDAFADAAAILSRQPTSASNDTATKEVGEPDHAGNAGGKSLWWKFVAPHAGEVRIITTGSDFDTLLAVYVGDSVGTLSSVAANDDFGGTLQSRVEFDAVEGTTYRIAVDGYNGASGTINLLLTHGPARNDFLTSLAGLGFYERLNNSTWFKIHNSWPIPIAAGDLNGNGKDDALGVFGSGLWVRYDNGTWLKWDTRKPLHVVTGDVDGNGVDDVVADFAGYGIWRRINNATVWTGIHSSITQGLALADLDGNGKDDLLGIFGSGLWARYDNGTWLKWDSRRPLHFATGDVDGNGVEDVVADFTGFGTWQRINNAAAWTQLHPSVTRGLALGDLDGNDRDDFLGVFGSGLWVRYDSGTWAKLNPNIALHVLTVDLDSDGRDDVVADFTGLGLYMRLSSTGAWTKLSTVVAQGLAIGGFD